MLTIESTNDPTRSAIKVSTTALADEDRAALKAIVDVLQLFTDLRPTIPAHQVAAFLRLALEEGKSNKEYAAMNKISTGVMSAVMLGLGKKTRQGEEGLMLVEDRPSPHSLKEYQLFLTPKGRGLRDKIVKRVKKTS